MTLASKALLACGALLVVAAGIGASTLTGSQEPLHNALLATTPSAGDLATDEVAATSHEPQGERVDIARPDSTTESERRASPTKRFATISGHVFQADSEPAPGVTVIANSFIGSGMKVATYAGAATTDEDGAYSMQVEVHHADGEDYRVHVRYENAMIADNKNIRVVADEKRTAFDLTLEGQLEETDGEYELHLTVADEEGIFLPAGSTVILERNLATVGNYTYPHWEAGGRLDVSGSVLLTGSKLGPKKIRATVRQDGEWLEYECFFDIERSGSQIMQVTAKFISRSTISEYGLVRDAPKFGVSGTVSELRTGKAVLAVYPDVWYYRIPELTPRALLYDFLPNKIFRGPFQSAAFGEAPAESNRFESYGLQAGRYIAMGYDRPYAPTFSDVVELTEEYPRADDLKLRYDVPGSVEGVVLDTNGKPLAGVVLFVTGTGPISSADIADLDELVRKSHGEGTYHKSDWKTDTNGRYTIDGISPEIPIRVIALHPTRKPASSRTVFVTAGVTLANLDMQFQRERSR